MLAETRTDLRRRTMHTYYHGTEQYNQVEDAIVGRGRIRTGFHMTQDYDVAAAYAGPNGKVVKIEVENDIAHAHVGLINKAGNYNGRTGYAIETVLKTPAAVIAFYNVLYDAEIM